MMHTVGGRLTFLDTRKKRKEVEYIRNEAIKGIIEEERGRGRRIKSNSTLW